MRQAALAWPGGAIGAGGNEARCDRGLETATTALRAGACALGFGRRTQQLPRPASPPRSHEVGCLRPLRLPPLRLQGPTDHPCTRGIRLRALQLQQHQPHSGGLRPPASPSKTLSAAASATWSPGRSTSKPLSKLLPTSRLRKCQREKQTRWPHQRCRGPR